MSAGNLSLFFPGTLKRGSNVLSQSVIAICELKGREGLGGGNRVSPQLDCEEDDSSYPANAPLQTHFSSQVPLALQETLSLQ